MVDWDASSDVDRDTIPVMYRAALSASWNGDPKIVFVDEVEHITTSQQQQIADIIDASRHPVILACNHYGDVHESVKDACMTIEFGAPKTRALERLAKRINDQEAIPDVSAEDVAGARSFRQLLSAACGGSVGVVRADDFDTRIRQLLRGEDVDLRPSEYWLAKAWLLDNSNGTPAGEYDRWLARYRDVGSSMEKYIKRAVRQVQRRCRQPRFPWSVTVQGESDDEEEEERDADDEEDEGEEGASGSAALFF
jgi:DNA polymerase III delta prime subunit